MIEKSEKLKSEVWAGQWVIIKFCVEVRKTPTQTKKLLDSSSSHQSWYINDIGDSVMVKPKQAIMNGLADP